MRLNKAQAEAVEYLEGPLLVLAGPGTGKTQLLSSRVAHILEETDANPENILCITFTEAATANMRDRLASIIGMAAHHVNIHTYHAFGSDILKQYRNYADKYMRPLDANVDEVTTYKIIHDLLNSLDPMDPLRSNSIKDITDTIGAAKKARLSPEDLVKIGEHNKADAEKYLPEVSDLLNSYLDKKIRKYAPAREEVFEPILEVLVRHTSPEPIAAKIEPLANYLARELDAAIKSQEGLEKQSVQPLTKWRDAHFEKTPNGEYRLKDHIANMKLESVAKIYREYQEYLAANGLYDFNDMIEEAVTILSEDDGFRATLQEKYQYILLDEFQDTNPSQFRIIELLTDYEQPQVMAVGDDDQTIFEFQGARPDNLLDFQRRYNAKVINLSENYRSTAEIVELGRAIADQIDDSFAKTAGIDKRLVAVRDGEIREAVAGMPIEGSAGLRAGTRGPTPATAGWRSGARNGIPETASMISRHEFTSADGEYMWVAERIRGLLDAGARASEIAVITPQHKYIQPLLPYLKGQKIPIAYEKSENILEDTKIGELTNLAQFIYNLAQAGQPAHKLMEILAYPFWGVAMETVVSHIQRDQKKPTLEYLLKSGDEGLERVGKILTALVAEAYEAPMERFLDMLMGSVEIAEGLRSPFLDFYSEKQDFATFELYNNLEILREKAVQHTRANNPTLKDFVQFLGDYQTAGAAVTSTSPYQDAENSVQIMTVHKSKGLEFEYVFLVAVDDDNWGNAGGNRNMLSLPKNLLSIRQSGTSESELLRKFFVAITRAKSHLVMTNSKENYAGKKPPRLEYLAEYTDDAGRVVSPLLQTGEVETHYESIDEAKLRTDLRLGWLGHYLELTPNLREILLKRLENYKLNATDLTNFIDIRHGGPQEFYKNKVLRAPQEPASASLNLGNLIHATFEKITKDGISDAEAKEFCQTQLEELPLTDEEKAELEALAKASLEKSLPKFSEIIRAENSRAELDFYSERPTLDGIPLAGKIDHLNINEKEKTIEVYDFKTSKYIDKKWGSRELTLYKYQLQLGFYKLLLNLSPTYGKYTVTRGHILFVKPDRDFGEVYDKAYDYNAADEAELKTLIKNVYGHIKTLDFLDDPALNIAADPSHTNPEVFDFIELMLAGKP